MKKLFIVYIFLGMSFLASSQKVDMDFSKITNAKKSMQAVEKFIDKKEYDKALRQLDHTLKIKPDWAIAYRLKGAVEYFQNKYADAVINYEKAFELDSKLSRAALFECAESYLFLENIAKAKDLYLKYDAMKGESYANAKKESGTETGYDKILKSRIANCDYFAKSNKNRFGNLKLDRMGSTINSRHDDYLPCLTNDGSYLIFTRNINELNEDIYISQNNNSNNWQDAKPFSTRINSGKNEGMAKFQTIGNTFYFAGHNNTDNIEDCNILQARFDEGQVTDFYEPSGDINTEYWDSQPSVTCDGTRIFFSSSRPGGYGGSDIWMSVLDELTGDWGFAQNLGSRINTPGDEESPYIANDGHTIYFSSNGHEGFGNGDLFLARYGKEEWNAPENLGYPINSAGKELGIFIQNNDRTAWIASSRIGTEGGLDIYNFELPEEFQPEATIPVAIHLENKITEEGIAAKLIISNEGNRFVRYSDANGNIELCLPGNQGYSFQVHHEDFDPLIEATYIDADKNLSLETINMYLMPYDVIPEPEAFSEIRKKKIEIYFDFNSSEIPNEYLNDLIDLSELINQYDGWSVQAYGFADNIGDANYNQKLSKERAQKVVNFIAENCNKIIDSNVQTVGKGSIASNNDDDQRFSRKVEIVLER